MQLTPIENLSSYPGELPQGIFSKLLWDRGWKGVKQTSWDTDASSLDRIAETGSILLRFRRGGEDIAVISGFHRRQCYDSLLWLALCYGRLTVAIGTPADDPSRTEKILSKLEEAFPVNPPPPEDLINVIFWSLSARGPIRRSRKILAPRWSDISKNYPGSTLAALEPVMNGFRPSHGGQLLLWRGDVGTGKTWCLRALGQQWKDWCRLECVTDPEAFFGEASYMMEVLMGDGEDEKEGPAISTPIERWRLLILEDTGELLSADAKERSGQSLSRLLNVVDGLIGQGLRVLALVTTNEPLQSLHPAIARPGRCAVDVEFELFSQEDAKDWLATYDIHDVWPGRATLAELYGRLHDFHGAKSRQRIGLPEGQRAGYG